MVFVTSPDRLTWNVPKCNIRNKLFGNIPTEWIKDQQIVVVENWPIGAIRNVYTDYLYSSLYKSLQT